MCKSDLNNLYLNFVITKKTFGQYLAHHILLLGSFAAIYLDSLYFHHLCIFTMHSCHTDRKLHLNQSTEWLGQDRSFEYVSQVLIQTSFPRRSFVRQQMCNASENEMDSDRSANFCLDRLQWELDLLHNLNYPSDTFSCDILM